MKKIYISLTLFILLSTSIITAEQQANSQIIFNNKKPILNISKKTISSIIISSPTDFLFEPEDIVLMDDAFHGITSSNFAEWWYFDAIFDNGYSIQITIYVFDIFSNRFVVSNVNIYNNEINILSKEDYFIFNNINISSEIPFIEVDDKQILKGYIDEISGDWIYDVTVDVEGASIDLQFKGESKGWKGNLSIGGWAVIIPKGEVKGRIKLFGMEEELIGVGYHDHNWDMDVFDLINYGWYWGKIHSDNYTIVWFIIMKTRFKSDYICLVSENGGNYSNINSEDIYFTVKDYKLENLWLIPNSFILKVDNNKIYFAFLMRAISIDSQIKIRLGRYWRYHLECLGNIVIDNEVMDISEIQIAEFMRFRFI
jgi:hypothetical protein